MSPFLSRFANLTGLVHLSPSRAAAAKAPALLTIPRSSVPIPNGSRRATRVAKPASSSGTASAVAMRAGSSKAGRPGSNVTVTSPKKTDRQILDEKHADQDRERERRREKEQDEVSTTSTSRFSHWAGLFPAVAAPSAVRLRPVSGAAERQYAPLGMGVAQRRRDLAAMGITTPEKMAAFILNAGKARAPGASTLPKPSMDTPDGVAAMILAAGRRAGIVK